MKVINILIALSLMISSNALDLPDWSILHGSLFEGDIAGIEVSNISETAIIDNDGRRRWPGGVVPYKIDNVYNQNELNIISLAMRQFESQTRSSTGVACIRFVPHTNQPNWIRLISDNGCYSYMGKQNTGAQAVSLQKNGCVYKGIIIHELMHAIGFFHEQSRTDRDNYVTILWNNMMRSQNIEVNFMKYDTYPEFLRFPYDYDSIMHYDTNAFSANGRPTILPKINVALGQREKLSSIDIQKIRKYYNCQ